MKKMKLIYLFIFCFGCSYTLFAQDLKIDRNLMQQDIKVAEGILESLFNNSSSEYQFSSGRNVFTYSKNPLKSQYIPDYGVRLHIKASYLNNKSLNRKDEEMTQISEYLKKYLADYASLIHQLKPSDKILITYQTNYGKSFFVEQNTSGAIKKYSVSKEFTTISAEIDKKSISDLKAGNLNREAFMNKVVIREEEYNPNEKSNDNIEFKVFAEILSTLFQDNQADYTISSDVPYQKIDGFGVNYKLYLRKGKYNTVIGVGAQNKVFVYPDNEDDKVWVYAPEGTLKINGNVKTPRKKNKDKDGAKVKFKSDGNTEYVYIKDLEAYTDSLKLKNRESLIEAFEDIEEKLRIYMIEYGRTLKSLGDEEILVIEVFSKNSFWSSEQDNSAYLRLSVKKSVLNAFDKQQISLEEAKSKINKESN